MTTETIAPAQSRSIDSLSLRTRAANALKGAGIVTIGDLAEKTTPDLLAIKGFGKSGVEAVDEILNRLGLTRPEPPAGDTNGTIDTTAENLGEAPDTEAGTAIAIDHALIDKKLREGAHRISSETLDLLVWAKLAIDNRVHDGYGHKDASTYFEERIGVSYRSVVRWISIHDALQRIPEGPAREAMQNALADVGVQKASILAPLIGVDGVDGPAWVEKARVVSREALQEAVSEETDANPRGRSAGQEPGARFYKTLLNMVPPEVQEEVRTVFETGMAILGNRNAVAVFICMVQEVANEWANTLKAKQEAEGAVEQPAPEQLQPA